MDVVKNDIVSLFEHVKEFESKLSFPRDQLKSSSRYKLYDILGGSFVIF